MLVCKLETWPGGDATDAYPVGEVRIAQTDGDCFVADYKIQINKAARTARSDGIWRTAEIHGFNHDELGVYDLLLRGLIACLGGRSHAAVAAIRPGTSIFRELETETA